MTSVRGIIGGIEGGATHSNIILLNPQGRIIGSVKGPGTNHHLMGMPECCRRISQMVNEAKTEANIPHDTPLAALGLSLSGCENPETNEDLVEELRKTYPNLSESYAIGSDSDGSIHTTSNRGGIVCIAGTGSNTLLINPDGSRAQCGGWGFLLGDEGSAWKIAKRAVKYCFDDLDGFERAPHPIDKIWDLIKSYFKVKSQPELLDHFYGSFDKAKIAQLCKELSVLALGGDKLSIHIFEEAGSHLARAISVVVKEASPELANREGGIQILCVGSVWLSWDLLKKGFIYHIQTQKNIKEMSLVRLSSSMGVGAAYMAADKLKLPLERDYIHNYKVLYNYVKKSS